MVIGLLIHICIDKRRFLFITWFFISPNGESKVAHALIPSLVQIILIKVWDKQSKKKLKDIIIFEFKFDNIYVCIVGYGYCP